ncbi:MAG: phosphotransferase family protein, partial [Ktedonobacteraceae bacterium]
AQVTALEIEQADGETKKMVVRRHGEVDLQHNPQIAADEFRLLQRLQAAGLATPQPYHIDQSGKIFPTPYLVMEYIEGQTEFAPTQMDNFILQFATHLARIHQVEDTQLDASFLPRQAQRYAEKLRKRPTDLDESLDEEHIRDVLEAVWPVPQHNASVLLHGDYWPGNVLWRDGQLVAVIDWEDAEIGDPLADIANSRLELLWAFGSEAMQSFTQHYQAMTTLNFTNLSHWDLWAALRPAFCITEWAGSEISEKRMRERHRWFITQAFEKLSVQ